MQQNAAVSIAQEVFLLAQRGVWAKTRSLLILQFSIKARDVSGVKTAQISKFCWVFFFRPETSLGLKENERSRKCCIFHRRVVFPFGPERCLEQKVHDREFFGFPFAHRRLWSKKSRKTQILLSFWKKIFFKIAKFLILLGFCSRDVSGLKGKPAKEEMARFRPETSLGQKENQWYGKRLHFWSPSGFSFWPREVSGHKRVSCYFCGFPLSPETSLERHPTKFQNFAKYLKKKTKKKSGKRRLVYSV